MATSAPAGAERLPELRIALLGQKGSGKSSAGNTILGRKVFNAEKITLQCRSAQGEVAGRRVTVVDSPGWRRRFSSTDIQEWIKPEIMRCVSMCEPGPHVVLLTILIGPEYSAPNRTAAREYLEVLGKSCWKYIMVLFTRGDKLVTPEHLDTIENHIEAEGRDLKRIVEKCGNRIHVLDNKNREDCRQVTEMMEKIEEIVAGNAGHFQISRRLLRLEENRRNVMEDIMKTRLLKVQKERDRLSRLLRLKAFRSSELRMVLLGWIFSGKSLSGNTILGRREFEDCSRTKLCWAGKGKVAGYDVTVVDTPGWERDSVLGVSEEIKHTILQSVSLCPPGPHVFLLVIPTTRGSISEIERNGVKKHMALLGKTVWSHTIIVFTMGDCLDDTTIEQLIEREGEALQWMVEKCGNRYHVFDNTNKGDDTQVTELLQKIAEMVAGNMVSVMDMEQMKPLVGKEEAEELELMRKWTSIDLSPPSLRGSESSGYNSMRSLQNSLSSSSTTSQRWPLRGRMSIFPRKQKKLTHSVSSSSVGYYSDPATTTMGPESLLQTPLSTASTLIDGSSLDTESALNEAFEYSPSVVIVFTPEIVTEASEDCKSRNPYRLQGSHAGQFQCSWTNLVFVMEGKGQVVYRTATWDNSLLHSMSKMAAGPLYNISCYQGAVRQLHLPHCGILSEERQDLCVAHVTGDGIEVMQPLEVTDSHVIIDIKDFSLFGLIRRWLPYYSVCSQVLLFLRTMVGTHQQRILNILLLPRNVPLNEVKEQQQRNVFIQTSSNCNLTSGEMYRVCCDPEVHKIQPESERFDCDYGPNYHPTFEVFLKSGTEDVKLRLLDGDGKEVWRRRVCLTDFGTEAAQLKSDAGAQFVEDHKAQLIERITEVLSIADSCYGAGSISYAQYSNIRAASTSQERMRVLFDALHSGGAAMKSAFYRILQEKEQHLLEDLGSTISPR